jgi:hypothetical protein
MKSSRSIHSSREKGTARLPQSGFCGWLGASIPLPALRVVVDDQLERIEHGDAARARALRSSRMHSSSTP